jgi:hypothetical protein
MMVAADTHGFFCQSARAELYVALWDAIAFGKWCRPPFAGNVIEMRLIGNTGDIIRNAGERVIEGFAVHLADERPGSLSRHHSLPLILVIPSNSVRPGAQSSHLREPLFNVTGIPSRLLHVIKTTNQKSIVRHAESEHAEDHLSRQQTLYVEEARDWYAVITRDHSWLYHTQSRTDLVLRDEWFKIRRA